MKFSVDKKFKDLDSFLRKKENKSTSIESILKNAEVTYTLKERKGISNDYNKFHNSGGTR